VAKKIPQIAQNRVLDKLKGEEKDW